MIDCYIAVHQSPGTPSPHAYKYRYQSIPIITQSNCVVKIAQCVLLCAVDRDIAASASFALD